MCKTNDLENKKNHNIENLLLKSRCPTTQKIRLIFTKKKKYFVIKIKVNINLLH